jgi:hypothetical protein
MRGIVPLTPEHIAHAAVFARGYRTLWEAIPLHAGAYIDRTILATRSWLRHFEPPV